MRVDDIRYLFGYDRWATGRVLTGLDDIEGDLWSATDALGERGLGSILVHQLGSSQRWRHAIQQDGEEPRPENETLLTIDELRRRWAEEWDAVAVWLQTLDDAFLAYVHEGVPVWQMLAHVANHGTQHRAEAAALLTAAGHSPGDLDMFDYAEMLAAGGDTAPGGER
jgi:uncharacterized damage-inducible protein DinB